MRKLHAIFIRFLTGLACLLLGACFEAREEIWIDRGGSGRAELSYTLPGSAVSLAGGAEMLEDKIRDLIGSQPELRLDAVSVTSAGDDAVVTVKLSADSMLALLDLKKSEELEQLPSSVEDLAGNFDVRLRGLDIDFSRKIDIGKAMGIASLAVGANDRRNRRLVAIIHLPKPALESNATRTEGHGRTLVWEATLGEALRKPVITRFRASMPIPWYAHLVAALLLLGVALSIAWWWRRRRSRLVRENPNDPAMRI